MSGMRFIRMKVWQIEWRGLITRDVGHDIQEAYTEEGAKALYRLEHPTRRVMKATLLENKDVSG